MNTQGFVLVSKDAEILTSGTPNLFLGKVCEVMDWAVDGSGALVIAPNGSHIADINSKYFQRSFKCDRHGDVLIPTGLSELSKFEYFSKVMMRKGGYNKTLMHLVIAESMHKGFFSDSVLFQN